MRCPFERFHSRRTHIRLQVFSLKCTEYVVRCFAATFPCCYPATCTRALIVVTLTTWAPALAMAAPGQAAGAPAPAVPGQAAAAGAAPGAPAVPGQAAGAAPISEGSARGTGSARGRGTGSAYIGGQRQGHRQCQGHRHRQCLSQGQRQRLCVVTLTLLYKTYRHSYIRLTGTLI